MPARQRGEVRVREGDSVTGSQPVVVRPVGEVAAYGGERAPSTATSGGSQVATAPRVHGQSEPPTISQAAPARGAPADWSPASQAASQRAAVVGATRWVCCMPSASAAARSR